jgi:PIN domain nuclease of toxin-antitoxin system
MKLLLDTHAFMWWDGDPGKLSAQALAAIRDPANEVWFSAVNIWEMVIKAQLSKITLRLPLADIVAKQQANGLRALGVTLAHVLPVEALPPIHKDPFDRLLAAQANAEGAELVTGDPVFAQYPVRVLW